MRGVRSNKFHQVLIAIAILVLTFNFNIQPNNATTSITENKLAINWQPAFCETHPHTKECRQQTPNSFETNHFTLHGLWSKQVYCNVNRQIENIDRANKWSDLPPIKLSAKIANSLAIKMPGVASNLHLHEWYKHGTCYSTTPEEYYQESLALLDQVNNSKVRNFFVKKIDNLVFYQDLRNQFNRAFGKNTGAKVAVKCQKDREPIERNLIVELQLNLKGKIEPNTAISHLLKQGKTATSGCAVGEVDRAGLN